MAKEKEKTEQQKAKPAKKQKTMTGAEMVIQALLEQGVEVIFGYPGGAVLPKLGEAQRCRVPAGDRGGRA